MARGQRSSISSKATFVTLSRALCSKGILALFGISELPIVSESNPSTADDPQREEMIERFKIPRNASTLGAQTFADRHIVSTVTSLNTCLVLIFSVFPGAPLLSKAFVVKCYTILKSSKSSYHIYTIKKKYHAHHFSSFSKCFCLFKPKSQSWLYQPNSGKICPKLNSDILDTQRFSPPWLPQVCLVQAHFTVHKGLFFLTSAHEIDPTVKSCRSYIFVTFIKDYTVVSGMIGLELSAANPVGKLKKMKKLTQFWSFHGICYSSSNMILMSTCLLVK